MLSMPALAQHTATVTWTAPGNAPNTDPPTSYNIKRSTVSGGPYITVGSTPAGLLQFVDSNGVLPGLSFFYVISSVNSGGESVNSAEGASGPIPTFPPAAPGAPTVTKR